jgi:hypothetical protein
LWSRSEQKYAKIPPPLSATTKLDFVFTRPGSNGAKPGPLISRLVNSPLRYRLEASFRTPATGAAVRPTGVRFLRCSIYYCGTGLVHGGRGASIPGRYIVALRRNPRLVRPSRPATRVAKLLATCNRYRGLQNGAKRHLGKGTIMHKLVLKRFQV